MITITEPKIAGLTPRWAEFPGFSLLFDNPGKPFRREGDFETLDCDFGDDFYRRLHNGFLSLNPDRLLQTYLLCPLPPASYHVTAYDIVNVGDLGRCREGHAPSIQSLLNIVPDGLWRSSHPLLAPVAESALVTAEWNLRFRYDALDTFGGNGIFIRLRPADEDAEVELDRFREARAELSRFYRDRCGVGASERYRPHVSLAYFANREMAELGKGRFTEWDAVLREAVGDEILAFRRASLYAFTSMANFFRAAG